MKSSLSSLRLTINVAQMLIMAIGYALYLNSQYGAAIVAFSFSFSLAVVGIILTFVNYNPKKTKSLDTQSSKQ